MHGRRPWGNWGDGPPQNLGWGTAHASVPPIFLEVVLSRCARKYEQSKKWCHQGILWRSRGFWFCGEERVICDIWHSKDRENL